MVDPFIHLHVKSGYSFKYGTSHVDDLVLRAAEYGAPALALTDRQTMAGAVVFAQSCERAGISPILGVNLSFLQKKYRVTVLAQSGKLSSLYRFLTALNLASSDGILTHEFLEAESRYSRDLLLLYGPDSPLGNLIAQRQIAQALSLFSSTRDLFADQAIEIVSHRARGDGPYSTSLAARSLAFARAQNIPAVLTNAVRMRDPNDGPLADILDATRQMVPLHQKHIERANSEGYLKKSQLMYQIATEVSQAAGELSPQLLLRTTRQWAERSTLSPRRDIGLGSLHLPEPSHLGHVDHSALAAHLRSRCMQAVEDRYGNYGRDGARLAAIRLEEELATVSTLGYEAYFLAVADIVDMARRAGIRTAARGSGAGSFICYLLGISAVNPLEHGLLMERFCTTLRRELPDIDIDAESARRLEIYDGIFERYGIRCATVSMVETYRARHAIRDVGAALGLPPSDIGAIAKSLPHIRARNISKALAGLPELRHLNLTTPLYKAAIALAERLDGLPRHLAMHPCAIALSDSSLYDRAPIEINASGYRMLQYDKDGVEAIGLLKLDVLGVRMQSALAYAVEEVERTEEEKIDIDGLPLDDPDTYRLIQSTRTLGVFQIESPGQRELIGKFAPSTFNDLIIDISLFRPGPVKSDMITPFLNARQGFTKPSLLHPDLVPILQETEGVVVFHEQVIQIIATLTGCTLAEADERRRQLGTFDGQQAVCDWFYSAALSRGYPSTLVLRVWEILRAFASFGFCKAHAAAFALPTYQSAWLKTHHPAAFFAAVLTHDPGMYPKRVIIDDARQMGIAILSIDINHSDSVYRVEPIEHTETSERWGIRLPLSGIDGIATYEVERIIARRPYRDLADFLYRSGASRPTTEALLRLGAFDALHNLVDGASKKSKESKESKEGKEKEEDVRKEGLNRRDLLLHLYDLYQFSPRQSEQRKRRGEEVATQLTLELEAPAITSTGLPALVSSEKVATEMELLGMDISHHLLEFYGEFLNAIGAIRSKDLLTHRSRSSVLVAGVKVALQSPPVRSGKRVIFLTLDDGYGCNDITFFEDVQKKHARLLYTERLFLVRGEIRRTGVRGISLRATDAWSLPDSYAKWHDSCHANRGAKEENRITIGGLHGEEL
jgi:error-prone DNA polymerase